MRSSCECVLRMRVTPHRCHALRRCLRVGPQALFLSIVIFLLFVLYLLKTGHAMERRWNDRETSARFPKALFNEYETLNLKIRAAQGPLSRRGCRRKLLHYGRKAVCHKSREVKRLEQVEENLVYAAIRARFLVPEATAAGTTRKSSKTGRRGSTVADVMQSATGQPARVTLSEESDTVYKERGMCLRPLRAVCRMALTRYLVRSHPPQPLWARCSSLASSPSMASSRRPVTG